MRKARFTEDKIVGMLKEYEAGAKVDELCRRHGMSQATFYKWKAKYADMGVNEVRRLKELEDENAKLKKLLAEAKVDNDALKTLLAALFSLASVVQTIFRYAASAMAETLRTMSNPRHETSIQGRDRLD